MSFGDMHLAEELLEDWYELFNNACTAGNLNTAKCLYDKAHQNIDISAYDELIFRQVCLMGHFEVAQWLLQIKPDINVSAKKNEALVIARRQKKLAFSNEIKQKYQSIIALLQKKIKKMPKEEVTIGSLKEEEGLKKTETITEYLNRTISEAVPEAVSEAVPEAVSEAVPEAVSEAVPEAVSEAVPEAVSEAVSQTAVNSETVVNSEAHKGRGSGNLGSRKNNIPNMIWVEPLSDEDKHILQNKFNSLCESGDLEAVKKMWFDDRFDIPRRNAAKCSINNLTIDKNTVLLTHNKKLAKWLENNRVDKSYI